MSIPVYQIDAFAEKPFAGNPAAVCLLEEARSSEWMQRVGEEMNLSETAFVVPRVGGFDLRWFTPAVEVPLCGHATLASAHALWETETVASDTEIRFHTKSGVLTAVRDGSRVRIQLPAIAVAEADLPDLALDALNVKPVFSGRTPDRGGGDLDFLIELESESEVRGAAPDFSKLKEVEAGIIVTARGNSDYDIVSRYFAACWGINEDPVTGAAHCSLTPYWTKKLGKTNLVAFQASSRGGIVHAKLDEDRVLLSGNAVTVLRGELLA